MSENILIAIAWPYANAQIHVGNLTGSHLPGDIVARYHRLKGDKVLVVSGTDSHGTPIVIAGGAEHLAAAEAAARLAMDEVERMAQWPDGTATRTG